MRKALMLLILAAMWLQAQPSYLELVCMSDTAGRSVQFWGPDTTLTLVKVTRVVYGSRGYTVTFLNGKVVVLPKPPFNRVELVYVPNVTEDTVKTLKKEDRKEEGAQDTKESVDKEKKVRR